MQLNTKNKYKLFLDPKKAFYTFTAISLAFSHLSASELKESKMNAASKEAKSSKTEQNYHQLQALNKNFNWRSGNAKSRSQIYVPYSSPSYIEVEDTQNFSEIIGQNLKLDKKMSKANAYIIANIHKKMEAFKLRQIKKAQAQTGNILNNFAEAPIQVVTSPEQLSYLFSKTKNLVGISKLSKNINAVPNTGKKLNDQQCSLVQNEIKNLNYNYQLLEPIYSRMQFELYSQHYINQNPRPEDMDPNTYANIVYDKLITKLYGDANDPKNPGLSNEELEKELDRGARNFMNSNLDQIFRMAFSTYKSFCQSRTYWSNLDELSQEQIQQIRSDLKNAFGPFLNLKESYITNFIEFYTQVYIDLFKTNRLQKLNCQIPEITNENEWLQKHLKEFQSSQNPAELKQWRDSYKSKNPEATESQIKEHIIGLQSAEAVQKAVLSSGSDILHSISLSIRNMLMENRNVQQAYQILLNSDSAANINLEDQDSVSEDDVKLLFSQLTVASMSNQALVQLPFTDVQELLTSNDLYHSYINQIQLFSTYKKLREAMYYLMSYENNHKILNYQKTCKIESN